MRQWQMHHPRLQLQRRHRQCQTQLSLSLRIDLNSRYVGLPCESGFPCCHLTMAMPNFCLLSSHLPQHVVINMISTTARIRPIPGIPRLPPLPRHLGHLISIVLSRLFALPPLLEKARVCQISNLSELFVLFGFVGAPRRSPPRRRRRREETRWTNRRQCDRKGVRGQKGGSRRSLSQGNRAGPVPEFCARATVLFVAVSERSVVWDGRGVQRGERRRVSSGIIDLRWIATEFWWKSVLLRGD